MTVAKTAVRDSYDGMAAVYDRFTAHHDYEGWAATLEGLARSHGLRGRRLLDAGCGTGKSFEPFLRRGYDVVAFDVSPAMASIAAAKAPGVPVYVHDVCELPRLGAFDLVCCLDDCLNYLLEPAELTAALTALAGNLAADGVLVFDLNTLRSYDDVLRNDTDLFMRYRRELIRRGVFEMPESLGRSHIGASHTEEDVDRSLEVAEQSLAAALDERASRP